MQDSKPIAHMLVDYCGDNLAQLKVMAHVFPPMLDTLPRENSEGGGTYDIKRTGAFSNDKSL